MKLDGDADNYNVNSDSDAKSKALRAMEPNKAFIILNLLVQSILMVILVSGVPTEIRNIRHLFGYLFFQPKRKYNGQPDYWWLRSPSTDDNEHACDVDSSGNVGNYGNGVWNSYGDLFIELSGRANY